MQPASRSIPSLALAGILSLSVLSVPSVAQNSSPTLIPFQAQLTNQANVLYQTGTYTITFNLYDQAVGGASLWTERHLQVGVINGAVNVFLGSIQTLPATEFTKTLYLGITIDADGNANTPDPEMIPRQMIIPAFHSKNSEKLAGHDWTNILVGNSNDPSVAKIRGSAIEPEHITAVQIKDGEVKAEEIAAGAVTSSEIADQTITRDDLTTEVRNGIVPVGAISAYWGTIAPAGWLLCHGQAVPAGSEYEALRIQIGANVPDLRGLFLRGINAGRTPLMDEGGNRAIGNLQQDSLEAHSHRMFNSDNSRNNAVIDGAGFVARQETLDGSQDYQLKESSNTPTNGDTSTVGGAETRPKNIAVNYIIKY